MVHLLWSSLVEIYRHLVKHQGITYSVRLTLHEKISAVIPDSIIERGLLIDSLSYLCWWVRKAWTAGSEPHFQRKDINCFWIWINAFNKPFNWWPLFAIPSNSRNSFNDFINTSLNSRHKNHWFITRHLILGRIYGICVSINLILSQIYINFCF